MIISPARKMIFVHIPKTGGTSLTLAYEARAKKNDILVGDTPKAQRRRKRQQALQTAGRLWKHSTLADIDGLIPATEMDDVFVFTMVRNPWARVLSYHAWLRQQTFDHPAVHLAKATGFPAFLADRATQTALEAHHYASYVTLPNGRERCDAFVRLEHLEEDLAPVEERLGFRLHPLPHFNQSGAARDYRGAYSEADAALVERLLEKDITRFGYRFEGI